MHLKSVQAYSKDHVPILNYIAAIYLMMMGIQALLR